MIRDGWKVISPPAEGTLAPTYTIPRDTADSPAFYSVTPNFSNRQSDPKHPPTRHSIPELQQRAQGIRGFRSQQPWNERVESA